MSFFPSGGLRLLGERERSLLPFFLHSICKQLHYIRHALGHWGQSGEKTNIDPVLMVLIVWWGRQTFIKIGNHGNVKIQLLSGAVLGEGVGRCCWVFGGPLGWICVVGWQTFSSVGWLGVGQHWVQIKAGVAVAWAPAGDSSRYLRPQGHLPETQAFIREEPLGRTLLGGNIIF